MAAAAAARRRGGDDAGKFLDTCVLDFTSALYLGMRHPSDAVGPWASLTTGVPAALSQPPCARRLAGELARLQGCERASLAPSTLHLFWDLFGTREARAASVFIDAGLYPVGRWGVERAAGRGALVGNFSHHDAGALRTLLRRHAHERRRPVVVTDGFCPGCGNHAPVKDYLDLAREYGGRLIMDDTQAIGIFGRGVGAASHAVNGVGPSHGVGGCGAPYAADVVAPYGVGGGGTLRRLGLGGPGVLSVSSLAKGFGVPVAVVAGASDAVERFERESDTRTHCSPPSNVVLRALSHALAVNRGHGDALRLRLSRLVRHFRTLLARLGLAADGRLFPVQTLAGLPGARAAEIHESLEGRGVRTVLRRDRCRDGARLSFIINALHTPSMLESAVRSLAAAGAATTSRGGLCHV